MLTRKLGSAFVPMSAAHLLRWWTPVRDGRPWFYWTKRDPNEPLGSMEIDEDELDDAVRPIVMWCLNRGWRTTPSCEGHFVGVGDDDAADGVDEALRLIAQDRKQIRAGTLTLEDSETKDRIRPHIPNWIGPDVKQTNRQVIANNGHGCMGFIPNEPHDWARLNFAPGLVEVHTIGPMVQILTHARTPDQVNELWGAIFDRLRGW